MSVLHAIGRPALLGLAQDLEAHRLEPLYSRSRLHTLVPDAQVDSVRAELQSMTDDGMTAAHITRLLRMLAEERHAAQAIADRIELVWSGPELPSNTSRDTSVVVRQLFREAKNSLLISSYAIDKGAKAQALFGELAARMDAEPDLSVRLFLNIQRPYKDETPETILLRQFADTFRSEIWPGDRLPEVFYDPRALEIGPGPKACLHAKVVVVDDERVFISSANFTEAAHERNIEAGALVDDASLARSLKSQFETLVKAKTLQAVGVVPETRGVQQHAPDGETRSGECGRFGK